MIVLTELDLPLICEAVGLVGVSLYACNYICLSLRILSSECIPYFVLNTMAAICVLVSLTQSFNLASALIQSFWIAAGSLAVSIRIRDRRRGRPRPVPPISGTATIER
ncbi:CBU_0592 family membrane protein [Litorisediminicola beolgyonensis]|uniref:CBU-0592-like domain-containing protein n=1 Tax=Litorisediminicola beolgyonensis TaxID=1173614 RepID=A0ABW3ZFR2_9RHOB